MRLTSYRTFRRTLSRLQLLYEVTIHSYNLVFEQGRERLRKKEAAEERIEFKLGSDVVKRPLKVVTFHARDVYPQLLQSTLLVRVVATYEAFLVDTVEEIAQRDPSPFMTEGRIEMPQNQFLTLARNGGALGFVVGKKLRQLTGGGLEEIRKWYVSSIGVGLAAAGQDMMDLEEIHDRRHLYVHRGGYADEQYCRRYPGHSAEIDDIVLVSEEYFIEAMRALDKSALHLKQAVEAKFPSPPVQKFVKGSVTLPGAPACIQYFTLRPRTPKGRAVFSSLDTNVRKRFLLKDVVVWMSDDGAELRYLVAGQEQQMTDLRRFVFEAAKAGDVEEGEGFKVKRE